MIPTVGPQDISEMLGKKPRWFIANYKKLHQHFDFPRALPGIGLRWSRQRVLDWINDRETLLTGASAVDEVAAARDRLEARIGRKAA